MRKEGRRSESEVKRGGRGQEEREEGRISSCEKWGRKEGEGVRRTTRGGEEDEGRISNSEK